MIVEFILIILNITNKLIAFKFNLIYIQTFGFGLLMNFDINTDPQLMAGFK